MTITGLTGAVHLGLSTLSLLFGSIVTFMPQKGGKLHRKLGYSYVVTMLGSMVMMLGVGKPLAFGHPFHIAGIGSIVTLCVAMVPVFKRPSGWLWTHSRYIYWSVASLYLALSAHILVAVCPNYTTAQLVYTMGGTFVAQKIMHEYLKFKIWIPKYKINRGLANRPLPQQVKA